MISFALAVLFAVRAQAGAFCDLAAANAAFDKSEPQRALELYEKSAKACQGDERLRAIYRIAESRALLFRYAEAAQGLRAEPKPDDSLWRARFALLRAELARENLSQYGYHAPEDQEEGSEDPAADVTRRTPEQWHAEVEAGYGELWALRDELKRRSIRDEAFFIDIQNSDLDRTATLWDFAVTRWTEYLLQEAPWKKELPDASRFVVSDYRGSYRPDEAPGLRAAALLEDAGGELRRLDRLMIPFDHGNATKAAEESSRDRAIATLKSWRESFSTPRAKAEATLRAATLSQSAGREAEVVALCRDAEARWPELDAAKRCGTMRIQIELPQLEVTPKFVPPPGKGLLGVRARNIPRLYARLYRVTEAGLREQWGAEGRRDRQWSHLRQLPEDVLKRLLSRPAEYSWSVETKPEKPYAWVSVQADPPALPEALYAAIVCSEDACTPGKTLIAGAVVNVTRLLLVGSVGPMGAEAFFVPEPGQGGGVDAPAFHLYALDAVSGRAAANARVEAYLAQDHSPERVELKADERGMASASVRIKRRYTEYTNASFDPLARQGASVAYWSGAQGFGHQTPAPIEVHLETDRPIYRPGQEVRIKVTALLRLPRGYKTYDRDGKIQLTASDPNGQTIHQARLALNAFGSASTKFTIPPGRLLGHYSISAHLSDFTSSFSGSASIQVEEYKRPEFETLVHEATGAWKFGRPAVVSGEARYYFGGPVPDATISYRVTRQRWIPWFCWWWRGHERGSGQVAAGSVTTDASGKFSFTFVPEPEGESKDPFPARFDVSVEARDAGGRTIKGSRSFTAGAKAYLFEITPPSGFFEAGQAAKLPVRLRNLNERAVAGRGTWTLHRLDGAPKASDPGVEWGGHFPETPSLEDLYKDVPDAKRFSSGDLRFTETAAAEAALGALPEGAYRFRVKAEDPWGGVSEQAIVLLSAGSGRVDLPLPSVALADHSQYVEGETARFLIGSNAVGPTMYVELWGGEYLLERRALAGGVRVLTVPVRADHKGGFTVRWFGAKDFRVRSGQARVEVPWKDKELRVKLDLPAAVKPGERLRGGLTVRDSTGKPVAGEALVRVYDRSLEYYAAAEGSWLGGLYPARPGAGHTVGSIWQPWANVLAAHGGELPEMLRRYQERTRQLLLPALRFNRSRVRYDMLAMESLVGASMDESRAIAAPMMKQMARAPAAAPMEGMGAGGGGGAKADRQEAPPAPPPPQARKDFSETAYFEPQLPVVAGKAKVSFKAPERLTDWRTTVSVVTKDIKRGTAGATFATRKELMVRVEMPRFYREGDTGRIQAMVHNETGRELTGEATLSVEENGARAETRLGLGELTRRFAVKPHGVSALSWDVRAPRGTGSFTVRAVARSGPLVDAEERDLPILPSRERLIESTLVALDGKTKKLLELAAFKEADPTREHESMTLQVDPQLALSILNSLPFLVRYPHECTEQVLNRYVPLSIVNAFYRKHPKLADAVKKIPKRTTLTPAWDRSDPRRMLQLLETPWEVESKGREPGWPTIDLLDPKVVEAQRADARQTLLSYQLGGGGFPWFPGGHPDPYITLVVLAGFAEALRYGVEPPEEAVRGALHYAYSELPKHLKAETHELSLVLWGAWVVTSFPRSYSEAAQGWVQAKAWVDFADKHGAALTPLGRALAAHVYSRLGEKAKAESYLDRAMDGAREDPIAGIYWQPEKISWVWYNDNVETHAFLLRTLLAVRPKDRRIPGMVQWLLFNRKGNEWKSTKASAAAIYSLLDVMKSRGALDKGDRYDLRWGETRTTKEVGALDWLAEPIRVVKFWPAIKPQDGKVSIAKDGPGLAFASLTWIYSTDKLPKASGPGMLELERRFLKRTTDDGGKGRLARLKSGDTVMVGDEIEVQLVVKTRSQFEYVHLKDPRGAGFEAETLTSGWKWDQLGRYEEPRDSLTNFFMSWLPHGEYVLRYRVRPTTPGRYRVGAAVLQSMYAPDMAAHSDGFELAVSGK
ncbi:MAG: hypothetical protein HY553_15505 [Elusimicrobia bacterium]|nr:hypothetical protein [Elusimicrobiota bacterium]